LCFFFYCENENSSQENARMEIFIFEEKEFLEKEEEENIK
jgi:hypothetical protein